MNMNHNAKILLHTGTPAAKNNTFFSCIPLSWRLILDY